MSLCQRSELKPFGIYWRLFIGKALERDADILPIFAFNPCSFHARTHDTFLVTKGKVQVWINDESRILLPGDLASVPPVSVSRFPRNQVFISCVVFLAAETHSCIQSLSTRFGIYWHHLSRILGLVSHTCKA